MIKILVLIKILLVTALLVTCERHDMYELASLGLPPKTALYLYYVPNLKNGNLGGREGADRICYQEGYDYHKFVQASTVKAFLSVSETDEIRFIVPVHLWYYPVYALNPSFNIVEFSSSWDTLWDGVNSMTLVTALGMVSAPPFWWSGSNANGSVVSGTTCNGWRNSSAATTGQAGNQMGVAMNWIGPPTGPQTCDSSHFLLCLAY